MYEGFFLKKSPLFFQMFAKYILHFAWVIVWWHQRMLVTDYMTISKKENPKFVDYDIPYQTLKVRYIKRKLLVCESFVGT